MKEEKLLIGHKINKRSLPAIIEYSIDVISRREQAVFACANAHSLMVSRNDSDFDEALQSTDLLVADGSGITLAGRILNADFGPRITGYDYFNALTEALRKGVNGRKARIFFMGSSQNTLDRIKGKFESEYRELVLCGMYSPPYGNWPDGENDKIIGIINKAEPDVVWVGMTAPKQEKWIHANKEKLNASIIGSVGAVFDFFAGTLNRAPAWMRKLGLEWLYRFLAEPKRTWRRHLISEPMFVLMVIKDRLMN